MNDERDLTPAEQEPDDEAADEAGDDLPLTSGVHAFAPISDDETGDNTFDASDVLQANEPPESDPSASDDDSDSFSYDQFSLGLESLVPSDPALDVEAALAAINVSTEPPAAPTFVPIAYTPALPMPPIQRLKRGSIPSVVPAAILIALGVWLTLHTTTDTPIDARIVLIAALSGLVVTLLAAWIAWGRWSRGLLLPALIVTALSAVLGAGLVPGGIDLTRGYPLLLTGLGAAFALTALLSRPFDRRALAAGVIAAAAGAVGLLVTNGVLPDALTASAAPLWPVPVVLLVAIWLAPLVFRRRSR